eukprot:gb/GFBE01001146.1/.p1 GENE.gb/GFBE01001146.1/~~gb/GFBE01001146.1/.p1  ORF type:complete len:144 (+),score=27.16 gb/GFBE01001146.1/:1-432(+)
MAAAAARAAAPELPAWLLGNHRRKQDQKGSALPASSAEEHAERGGETSGLPPWIARPSALKKSSSSGAGKAKCDDKVVSEAVESNEVHEAKEARKLRKALREIESLEQRAASGQELDPGQVQKVQRRAEYEERLAALSSWNCD